MESPNFTTFLVVGFHLAIGLYYPDCVRLLGGTAPVMIVWLAILPVSLLLRRRPTGALSLVVSTALFCSVLAVIRSQSWSLSAVRTLLHAPPVPVFVFVLLLAPGLFLVLQLDSNRLPHELAHWSGVQLFRLLLPVFSARERVLRRLVDIRINCALRGISLERRRDLVFRVPYWLVPLMIATICEAAYAQKLREMLGAPHRFIPQHPRKARLNTTQKVLAIGLLATVLLGLGRIGRQWNSSLSTPRTGIA